ncbi:hypothetical protein H2O64_17865 [Kordia sp. YSTF-M3]|uniref:Uncharacterized protein n=1 Tax=Kordia aestuariivivens TaxID=2759037 RepID=A0ABR7QE11_9FLAO|nr:hypothetical protein [Kordia aestuariivivens]MBC8756544.1 hypothetical protein [Kordia aestuariivivens]
MNTHVDKANKNKTEAAANAVAQKKDKSQAFHFTDNRQKTAVQLKMQETANDNLDVQKTSIVQLVRRGSGAPVLHKHADSMKKRRRFKRSIKTAIRRIQAIKTAGPATERQIEIHDEVLHSGQHHGMRNVTVQKLVGDLNDKVTELTKLNLEESNDPK